MTRHSKPVVSFDFDDTLCMEDGTPNFDMINLVHKYSSIGYACHIVTSRDQNQETFEWIKKNKPTRVRIEDFIRNHELSIKDCHFTNHNPKGPILKKINSSRHYDNSEKQLESAKKYGIETIKVLPPLKKKNS